MTNRRRRWTDPEREPDTPGDDDPMVTALTNPRLLAVLVIALSAWMGIGYMQLLDTRSSLTNEVNLLRLRVENLEKRP